MTHKKLKISEMRKPEFVNTIKWPQEVCFIPRAMSELGSSSKVCDTLNHPKVCSPSRYYPQVIENGWGKNPGQTPNGAFLSCPHGVVPRSRHTSSHASEAHGHTPPRIPQVLNMLPRSFLLHLPPPPHYYFSSGSIDFPKTSEFLACARWGHCVLNSSHLTSHSGSWLPVPNIYISCSFIPNFPGSCVRFYNW